MALPGDRIDLQGYVLTADEAQEAILDYLRETRGRVVSMWTVLDQLCTQTGRALRRDERRFLLAQITALTKAKKVIRYRRRYAMGRGRPKLGQPKLYIGMSNVVRISEKWV